jgi:MATE family multidrug resistance protein
MDAPAASAVSRPGAPAELIRADLTTLRKLAGPVVFSRLGVMAMGLTDAIVVGRFSPVQLGMHTLAWGPTGVAVTVSMGLLTGIQVMTSRAIGEGRPAAAGAVLRRGLVYAGLVGVIASLILAVLGPPLLHSLGLSKALADGATAPLIVFSLSMTPYVLSAAAMIWLEALSRPTPAMLMMWLANLVNLAIDLVLVPGRFGAPALGAAGGACATLGARTALMIAVLTYIARMPDARALGVFDKPPRDRAAEAEQRRIGFGAGTSNFFEVAAFAAMNVISGWVGDLTVAAWAIVINVSSIVFMVPLGLSTAASVMVGSAHGARDARGVNRAGVVGLAVTAGLGVLFVLIIVPARAPIAAVYTTSAPVLAMAAPALALACLFFIPDCIQVVTAQILRARGDVWAPAFTHLISYALLMGPLAWLLALPLHMGLTGEIWAVVIASLFSAGALLTRLAVLSRRASITMRNAL